MPTVHPVRLLQGAQHACEVVSNVQRAARAVAVPHHTAPTGGSGHHGTHLSLKPLCRPSESPAEPAVLLSEAMALIGCAVARLSDALRG